MLTPKMSEALTTAQGGRVTVDHERTEAALIRRGWVVRHPVGVLVLTAKGTRVRDLIRAYGTERVARYYL